MLRECAVCGAEFVLPRRRGRPSATCSVGCGREYGVRYRRAYYARVSRSRPSQAVREERVCRACGGGFLSSVASHWNCKRPECVRDRVVASGRGISVGELRSLRESPACALCGALFGAGRRQVVDHDHASGAVRSVLCDGCNVGLGHVERLGWEAQLYLARHSLDLRDLCVAA